jgi:predicted unusual protein kinase regulating ubiquinone biosynthesis (AarF/ABC1/UbiB family)
VQSYVEANALLPGADLKRLEEAHQIIFDRFWGTGMTEMRELALSEAPYLLEEYRDLIYEAPFQLQVDMLFAARAVGILSGLATSLDPNFDPWAESIPFAERLAKDELQRNWQEWGAELVKLASLVFGLPSKLDQVLNQAQRGSLSIETSLAPDARKAIGRLESSIERLTWAVVSVGVLLTGVILRAAEGSDSFNTGILVVAGVVFLWKVVR